MRAAVSSILAGLALCAGLNVQAQGVNRPFLCQPRNGESTCMRDVLVADDVTLAVLAGATDEYVEESVNWVRSLRDDERGWNQVTRRMSVLAMRGALEVDPRKLTVLRRADVKKTRKYLVPVARINSSPVGSDGLAMVMHAIESDSRISYGDTFADICSTTTKRRYCVRVDGLSKAKRVAAVWAPFENQMLANFRAATPEVMSLDWQNWTMLGVELELTDAAPKAINGARTVRATAKRLVLFNDSYLAGLPLGATP
jgi:hypothetical protein